MISLRPLCSTDLEDFLIWAGDDEVTKTVTWNSYKTKEQALEFLNKVAEPHPWFKAICLNDRPIGSISLNKGVEIYSCKAVMGYVLAKDFWGRGFTTQAVEETKRTCFTDLNISRIEAFVDPENIASQRVLEKTGFIREGLMRKCIIIKGNLRDRYIYSYLSTDKV